MKMLTEEELEIAVLKHTRRRKIFEEDGLTEDEAWNLADVLFERDKEGLDDRKLCYECKNHNRLLKNCKVKNPFFLPLILQRCPQFELKGKK
jgi:hypothetical protein